MSLSTEVFLEKGRGMNGLVQDFQQKLTARTPAEAEDVPRIVATILSGAQAARATDVHLVPGAEQMQMQWRIDGVLQPVATFPAALGPQIVARLKVLAHLLTYKTDIPQEGRIREGQPQNEMRVSTFPTLFGEKGVVRLFATAGTYRYLPELGLPEEVLHALQRGLQQTSGAIVLTGPAGAGKTTTIYASLREIVERSAGTRSLVSLEDPIEVVVPGVSQSQVNLPAGLDLASGLKSLLRQDPEVIMVGEIREQKTAEMVFQASLTGHLVLTTFHAGSAAQAVGRLIDLGIEPYLLRSGLRAIVCQRLLRRLCDCAEWTDDPARFLGLPVPRARMPVGCAACHQTGYAGRTVLAEVLVPDDDTSPGGVLSRRSTKEIEGSAVARGMITQRERARRAVEAGETSPAEVVRVLGEVAEV